MYTAGFLVVASLLAASANAYPEFNERRDCSHNNCLRAVIASAVPGGNARGSADCSSYFRKTVTASAATATITLTSTLTGDPVYSTVTSVSVVPVTVTTSVCTAAVVTVVPRADKREVTADDLNALPVHQEVHQVRHARACPAKPPASSTASTSSTTAAATSTSSTSTATTTTKATTTATPVSGIPTYASACGGVSAYSSACSCNGIPESTVTLPQVTNTVTAWASQTVIPTSATTVDIVSSSTTTVTIAANPTILGPSFYVMDAANGRTLAAGGSGLQLIESANSHAPLTINGCGRVASAVLTNNYLVSAGTGSGDEISFATNPSSGSIHCTVQNPSVPSGSFTCQSDNGVDTVLNVCPGNNVVQLSSAPMAGCLQPDFTVVHT
ncbi:uncharacterized protein TRIVIDRAFT_81599 [Trichoderma virens Gv29-8]|uniref:Uncharacterized protein n=1 Tax=Hypocrea virens (strain Gv29-8 / FGSC 10586) TaxID=413071 RepID=G9MU07_HYPVG|nr:uncharacterized protein TRIVIDRAFT_81599 [Trichoderma virens Gv29-8]EHK22071.1 hypothetical protein TRIVIDRAFT_81599 [Trichoderma virens Gv29-8]